MEHLLLLQNFLVNQLQQLEVRSPRLGGDSQNEEGVFSDICRASQDHVRHLGHVLEGEAE